MKPDRKQLPLAAHSVVLGSTILLVTLVGCGSNTSPSALVSTDLSESTQRSDETTTLAVDSQAQLTVSGFALVDAQMDQILEAWDPLSDGAILYLNELPDSLNIVALASQDTRSIQFEVNGSVERIDSAAPYALAGDWQGNYFSWTPVVGEVEVTATAFRRRQAQGRSGEPLTIQLQVEAERPPEPTEFTVALIDATTDQVIPGYENLPAGIELDQETLPSALALEAIPLISGVESVAFSLETSDQTFNRIQVENQPPYAIAGDTSGNFAPWSELNNPGKKQVLIEAYPSDNANGTVLASLVFPFSVVGSPAPTPTPTDPPDPSSSFDPQLDLISLHYDHAPDKDDGQSAAADRTLLESEFSCSFIEMHTLAVGGTYGENAGSYNPNSEIVMDTVFNPCGGYVNAAQDWSGAVQVVAATWKQILDNEGDIWVKEGGQSDLTADVVAILQDQGYDTRTRIHVIQHSNWNEDKTTDADLAYVKQETDYTRIKDANSYLNQQGGNDPFEQAALTHPVFGDSWEAAFNYYNPDQRLDFSDTGELMWILGLGDTSVDPNQYTGISIDQFRVRYLE